MSKSKDTRHLFPVLVDVQGTLALSSEKRHSFQAILISRSRSRLYAPGWLTLVLGTNDDLIAHGRSSSFGYSLWLSLGLSLRFARLTRFQGSSRIYVLLASFQFCALRRWCVQCMCAPIAYAALPPPADASEKSLQVSVEINFHAVRNNVPLIG